MEFYNQAMHEAEMASIDPNGTNVQLGYGMHKRRALNFVTLKGGQWLSDAVIHSFAAVMTQISTHRSDRRFAYVSSQLIDRMHLVKRPTISELFNKLGTYYRIA